MNKEFKTLLKEKVEKLNINLSDEELDAFYEYMQMILEWNQKINLTAIIEESEFILKHFVDSLTILKYIKQNDLIVDIGTGAGFPGIPLAIVNKENTFTLVDSLNKRINFLNEVKEKLKINNIETVHSRAEDFGQNNKYRETFDIAVSRAVANLSVLVEYLLPLVKLNGKIICMKGTDLGEEIKEADYAIKQLGGEIKQIEEFCLPDTDIKRTIIIIEKKKNTPKKFPRKAGMPSKQPLK